MSGARIPESVVDNLIVHGTVEPVRTVGIPPAIVDDLRHHLDNYAERGANGRVFVGERGAIPRRRNLNRLSKKATDRVPGTPDR